MCIYIEKEHKTLYKKDVHINQQVGKVDASVAPFERAAPKPHL